MISTTTTRAAILSAALTGFFVGGLPSLAAATAKTSATQPVQIHIDGGTGKAISTDLIGIFFEDINDAADGGLYAELVQNRSFEYTTADNRDYMPLTAWRLVAGQDKATLDTAHDEPLNKNNPTYGVLNVETPASGAPVRVVNDGFEGVAVTSGNAYDFSLFARRLGGEATFASVRLESSAGDTLAEAPLSPFSDQWSQQKVRLTATASAADARLVLVSNGAGRLAFDFVSLFPDKTFKDRPNGMRADLAQSIADLKPKFMRFPGGCVAHGNSLANMYRWKDTIGPVEQRRVKPNLWGYQQSFGLGYYEYFQYCEDIGAAPLPVVAAGVSCQFAPGGQKSIPMAEMGDYVQEVLDLIEWANGPATSTWGAKRAAAGHPGPFNLKYVGVGNEDAITRDFTERFKLIKNAVAAKYPDIVLIGTSGPFHSGTDFDRGWAVSREMGLKMVDEHYYVPPAWLVNNANRYDKYERGRVKVYLGEYAAHDIDRRRTLRAAIAEAAFLTGLERNADLVHFASYAPLLGKLGRTRWDPNLIYFTNDKVIPTISYDVQKLFGNNVGDRYLPTDIKSDAPRTVRGSQAFVGTWNTQAEFDDVRVVTGGQATFKDDFAEPASGELLSSWETRDGEWAVSPQGTYQQRGKGQPAVSRIASQTTHGNYVLSLRARKTGGDEGFLVGFGGVDDENYYWWNLGGWGNGRHAIEKTANGGKETVGELVPGKIETGRWYDVRVEVAGTQIRCFLDNKLVHQFRDEGFKPTTAIFASSVKDSATGEVILKLVNAGSKAQPVRLDLSKLLSTPSSATRTVLTGDPKAENGPDVKTPLRPITSPMTVGKSTDYEAPAHSFTVIRLSGGEKAK